MRLFLELLFTMQSAVLRPGTGVAIRKSHSLLPDGFLFGCPRFNFSASCKQPTGHSRYMVTVINIDILVNSHVKEKTNH